jgi:hypothetical protein
MTHSLLEQSARARRGKAGVPYIIIDDALPAEYYRDLERSFPDDAEVAVREAVGARNVHRRSAREVIDDERIPAIWRDFFAYHCSPAFFAEVRTFWAEEIARFHATIPGNFGKPLAEFTVGLRDTGKAAAEANKRYDIVLDCQFSINVSQDKTNPVRGPHLDSPYKLYAGLFYMRAAGDQSEGGDLEFCRLKSGRYPRPKPGKIDPRDVELVERIAYGANTLVLFLNTPVSVHGVTPRTVSPLPRRYINLLGECYRGTATDFFIAPEPRAPQWYRRLRQRIVRYT